MEKNVKYEYSINSIIDEIMKDAEISEALFGEDRFTEKTIVQKEVDNIVKFIKKRNQVLKQQGQKVDIKEFAKDIYQRFQ